VRAPVAVTVTVAVWVAVAVAVWVAVTVAVWVAVTVAVGVGVRVAVALTVTVAVRVEVAVAVGVVVAVGVAVAIGVRDLSFDFPFSATIAKFLPVVASLMTPIVPLVLLTGPFGINSTSTVERCATLLPFTLPGIVAVPAPDLMT
jgi:hypothetical protein